MDSWITHLCATLYVTCDEKGSRLHKLLTPVWPHFEVQVCWTKANRFYIIRCNHCGYHESGAYGHSETAEEMTQAQDAIITFLTKEAVPEDGTAGADVRHSV